MEIFVKICAGVLVALVLCLALGHVGKEFSFLLTLAMCCMIACVTITFLIPIYDFVKELINLGNLKSEWIEIVLKSAALGLLAEIICHICTDTGNASLGKLLQILSSGVILWLSIPLFRALISLAEEILREI